MELSDRVVKFSPYTLDDVRKKSSQKKFSVVTTFAGGGGSSTGYRLSGGDVLLANEFSDEAVKTYRENYPETPVDTLDIRKITGRGGKDYVVDWLNGYGVTEGEFDILDGSPPCHTFSQAGAVRVGKFDEKQSERHVLKFGKIQSRIGFLIHDFVYMVNCLQPRVFVIENVPNIEKSDVFKHAVERLTRSRNYRLNWKVLTSSHYGVPQKRNRLFIVGVRPDIARKVGIKSDLDVLDIYPEESSYEPTIREALDDLEINRRQRNWLLQEMKRSSVYELVKKIPKNPSKHLGVTDVLKDWNSNFNLRRQSFDLPSQTVTASGSGKSLGGLIHPSEDRKFTIKELKRLQGLPDDFVLTGTFDDQAERIGRMVPPLMTSALSHSIYEKVIKPSR